MKEYMILFYVLLFVVAFLYASVGHGGASGYLALMSFFSFAPQTMKTTALLLNIAVSLIAFIQYYRKGHFKWNLFWPFAIASIPFAFIGGLITLDASLYKKILAVLLLLSVIKLAGFTTKIKLPAIQQNLITALIIGGSIGLFSGMIGIGGGIILSPIIILLNWANMKETAAVSALFILVNSIAGLSGMMINGIQTNMQIILLSCIAVAGGLLGSYMGAGKLNNQALQRVLAIVLLIASFKLLLT